MSGLNVVNNSGTNYSLYYNVLDYFKTIMSNHPSIQTVTQGDVFEIDDKEFPAYPLGNILITDARFEDSQTIYSCQVTVADKIKLKNNESVGASNAQTIPFYGTDDTVDIHANTLSILNDLLSYTQYATTNFDIDGGISCAAFKDRFDNGLGGWVASFDLVTHNDRPRCLFNLLDVDETTTTTTTTAAPGPSVEETTTTTTVYTPPTIPTTTEETTTTTTMYIPPAPILPTTTEETTTTTTMYLAPEGPVGESTTTTTMYYPPAP